MKTEGGRRFLIVLAALFILIGLIGFNMDNKKNMDSIIDSKLNAICNNINFMLSSNPYDYTKNTKDYKDIVKLGDAGLKCMLTKFRNSNSNGLREYVMAIACSEILKEKPANKDWGSGREWYNNYIKSHSPNPDKTKTNNKISLSKAEKLIGLKPLKEVTTSEIWANIGVQIFKYKKDKNSLESSYLIKNNKVMELNDFGGIGADIKNMCVSDLDKDGKPELIYYYNFGSGLYITKFCCYIDGKLIPVKFGSIKFCGFKFIKKNMQNVEVGVWWPDIQANDKNSIPVGKLYIKDNALHIKLYDNISKEMKNYITEVKN